MTHIYKRYNYSIFVPIPIMQGIEKVGKTNIITRFTKDEFNQAHNMTLEGNQTAELEKNGKIFEINLFDTAGLDCLMLGQENMASMKAVWRNGKDGFLFVFALNNIKSFEAALEEIEEIKQGGLFKQTAIILVGNKSDLEYERVITKKAIKSETSRLRVKYFQVSAKTSSKDEIDALISELVDMNEMQQFYFPSETGSKKSTSSSSSLFSYIGNKCDGMSGCSCCLF